MTLNDAKILADQLRESAAAVGAHIVEGSVLVEAASTIPEVYLANEAALELIAVARPRAGSVRANALAVKPAAVGQANVTSPKARQSISLFQLVAGYNPARRVDVRSLPLVAA